MRARRQTQDASMMSPLVGLLHANFLALSEQSQFFKAENEDWNRKKALSIPRRRWSKKRLLVPPGAKAKPVRPSGAQFCNTNRLRHGKYARDRQLFLAELRSHIRAGHALAYAAALQSRPAKRAEAAPENSA